MQDQMRYNTICITKGRSVFLHSRSELLMTWFSRMLKSGLAQTLTVGYYSHLFQRCGLLSTKDKISIRDVRHANEKMCFIKALMTESFISGVQTFALPCMAAL